MKGTAYLLQSFLIILWWMIIWWNEDLFNAFQYANFSTKAFRALVVPDTILIAGLSLVRAYKDIKEIEFIILGAFAFITLYCIQLTITTQSGYLPSTIMVFGLFYNIFLIYNTAFFKESRTKNFQLNLIKTGIQIILVWGITLGAVPYIITQAFGHHYQGMNDLNPYGLALFILASALGLWSGFTMVKLGNGTPLPLDQTQNLVISGPYQYIRNPMAVAGILQGISISILLNSWLVFLYSIIGAILWNFVVRPIEEVNLEARFGEVYIQYKKEVMCWIPKIK